MRPLSPIPRTALFFYLIFAGTVILLSFWSKTDLETSAGLKSPLNFGEQPGARENLKNNSLPDLRARFTEVDLTYLQKTYLEKWHAFLARTEMKYRVKVNFHHEKLQTRRAGTKLVKWITTEDTLVLPDANSEEQIISLGSQWIGVLSSLGFTVDDIKGGYAKKRLWFTLSGCAGPGLIKKGSGLRSRDFILTRITLIQPLTKSRRAFWDARGLIPRLRPEFIEDALYEPSPVEKKIIAEPTPSPRLKKHPVAAIIIDDIGFTRNPADEMLKIAAPLTWSVLPFTPYGGIYIEEAKKSGFEIMLHLPLEAVSDDENPGPGVIMRNWSNEMIVRQLIEDLQDIPGAVGVNNHMGSAGTQDDNLMDVLMRLLKQRKLFFVDSYTDPRSVAEKYAGIHGVPFAKRKVFIDNAPDLPSQKEALHELIQLALKNGEAIGIAHAREGSAQAIEEMLPEFDRAGVEIVPVSQLVR